MFTPISNLYKLCLNTVYFVQVVDCLVKAGADLNRVGRKGVTPVRLAANRCHTKIVKYLASAGADLDAPEEGGGNALIKAAGTGMLGVVQCLVESGANIEAASVCSGTPLYTAVAFGHVDVARYILGAKASMRVPEDPSYLSHIMFAIKQGNLEMTTLLVESGGVRLGLYPNEIASPLGFACQIGDLAIARYLVSVGADIHEAGPDGASPIILASIAGHLEVVQFLVGVGADVNATTPRGLTALHMATSLGQKHVAEYLASMGAKRRNIEVRTVVPSVYRLSLLCLVHFECCTSTS